MIKAVRDAPPPKPNAYRPRTWGRLTVVPAMDKAEKRPAMIVTIKETRAHLCFVFIILPFYSVKAVGALPN
jgi:hypothetical protein